MIAYRHLPPSEQESSLARTSKLLLSRYAQENQSLMLQVIDTDKDERIELPAGAVVLLMDILGVCLTNVSYAAN